MTDIKVGDTVRVKESAFTYCRDAVGKTITINYVHNRGGRYVASEDYPGGFWLTDVELVSSAEATKERWRYNDHIVVYPDTFKSAQSWQTEQLGRVVTVLCETPLPKVYTRWENTPDRLGDEITDAARAYWDAHETNPVIKEAKTRGDYVRFAYLLRYSATNYTQADIDAGLPVIDRLALKESE